MRYPEGPPPDFSSWYSQPPRSGPGPGPGPGEWAGTRQGHRPPRRRSGLWWKIALVALVVLGAGAGAVTAMLLHHHRSGGNRGGSTSTTGTLPPTELINAINQPVTGAPPSGYRNYSQAAAGHENAGFSMDIPDGWSVTRTVAKTGIRTYLAAPGADDVHMLVDLTPHTFPAMDQEAEYIERNSQFVDYKRLGLARLTIRGSAGAWWKFTYLNNGVPQTALDLLFVKDTAAGPQSYALYATAPTSMWKQLQPVFDEELRTFAPLPR
jgi:hypothetical protein